MARRRRGQFPEPKQENGQWKIRYWIDQAQDDGTRERIRKTKCLGSVEELTATQARKEAWRFLQPINDLQQGIEHGSKIVQQLIARWQQGVKPSVKFSTQQSYEWAFKWIEPAFGKVPVQALAREDVQAFLTAAATGTLGARKRKPLSPESIRDLRTRLRGLLSYAEDWGWIPKGSNPAAGRLRFPVREAVRRRVVLTPAEFHLLVMALPQPYSTLVVLAVLAGLRRGELAALRWNDNRERGKIRIDEAVYWGKKDKKAGLLSWRLGNPKTPKSKREVSIGPMTQAVIDEWRKVAKFTGEDDFMFAIRTNSPIDLHTAVARHLKPAAVHAGVPTVSWHDLRHTYTTWGRLAGIKPETMRDLLGHSSVLMTLDVYSHAQDCAAEAAMIERFAGPKVPQAVVQ